MEAVDLAGKWYLTPKTFKKLGIDISDIKLLSDFPLKDLIQEEVSTLKLFLESHLTITENAFELYFAKPKKNKLKLLRKGSITNFCTDKKDRPCLCFLA